MIFKNMDILFYSPDEIPDNFIEGLRKDIDIEPQSFEHHFKRIQEKQIKYDIVFVDPWYTYNQSLKDLETALCFVSKSGFIVIHDCCPDKAELIGEYPKNACWCGQT
jgi:16S rRNA G966 N2-methylase RsmD